MQEVQVSFLKSAGQATILMEANRDYVISNTQLDRLMQEQAFRDRLYKASKLEPRLVPFHVSARRQGTQRVLLYNGSGGYGDQILTWPIARWLSAQGYDVHILTEPGNTPCWYNFNFAKTVNLLPMPLEQFKLYDYHIIMEQIVNADEHQDQLHPVDAMFVRMGVDPNSIDASLKVVAPVFSWTELNSVNAFKDIPKLGIYQLSSASPVRALPPNDSAFLISRLAEAYPDTHWLCLHDQFVPPDYVKALACRGCTGEGQVDNEDKSAKVPCPDCGGHKWLAKNILPYQAPNLRELWALISKRASVCVAPDSMTVHVAGACGVPCVGLWGPVAPANRMRYYPGHHPIWKREACPQSPCFTYGPTFPRYCPPRGNARNVCEVMAAINPMEVVEAVGQIRRQ